MARDALRAFLAGTEPPELPQGGAMLQQRGAFVTIEAAGALRGCIGHARADRSLAEVVRAMAVAAARDDPRFPPIEAHELHDLRIEISVLTEPVALAPPPPPPPPQERIVVGRDGVLVRRGGASGLLLPQVAPQYHWGSAALLAAACRKAGLAPDAWREPGTQVFTFQADVFSETRGAGGGMRES